MTTSRSFDRIAVNRVTERLGSRCKVFLAKAEGVVGSSIEYSVEARYSQQIWEIKLPIPVERFETDDDLARVCTQFNRLHAEIFSFDDPQAEIEFINWRAAVSGQVRHRPLGRIAAASDSTATITDCRFATFGGLGRIEVPVHRLEMLLPDIVREGPAIVETSLATIVVEPKSRFHRRSTGSLIVELSQVQERAVL